MTFVLQGLSRIILANTAKPCLQRPFGEDPNVVFVSGVKSMVFIHRWPLYIVVLLYRLYRLDLFWHLTCDQFVRFIPEIHVYDSKQMSINVNPFKTKQFCCKKKKKHHLLVSKSMAFPVNIYKSYIW